MNSQFYCDVANISLATNFTSKLKRT